MSEFSGNAMGTTAPEHQGWSAAPNRGTMRALRPYTRSNATRLLSAGVYLEKSFRKRVIHELLKCRFRVVAPSYGYDAVTVLAHALAARRLRRQQVACMIIGVVIDFFLLVTGFVGLLAFLLLAVWILWAFTFLRRAATLQTLITRLSPTARSSTPDNTDDSFPANPALTVELTEKIAHEQAGAGHRIFFGSYRPFVGAGFPLDDWTTAELLLPAQEDQAAQHFSRDSRQDYPQSGSKELIPFTVDEITDYVGRRLKADLQEEAPYGERIENLTVERREYSRAGIVPVIRQGPGRPLMLPTIPSAAPASGLTEDRERYDAAREYLCIRVGSWNEEVVTSVFVGFDLRGNTLYSEFYPYVLPPVQESFHLVDRMPARLTPRLLLRVAWDVPAGLPGAVRHVVRAGLQRLPGWPRLRGRAVVGLTSVTDASELRLGRYALAFVDRGAVYSVRELAAAPDFHLFFQEADTLKYTLIVQRRLLQIVRQFLADHNVDLGDHDRQGATILDNSVHNYRDVNNYGGGTINQAGRHIHGDGPRGQGGRQ